ncbi:restriction endonuclease [Hymenobacter armeniacus]|uniref:Restriction endonuclease n=1 Tax=Hymenobacter armeniacus TaxID=2771358 RepID=A0ABR8JUE3_9BACT|nr:restriction endonuclease [Hymenobacter armeniacus]MBD2722200.1 restriction endonuclease [Hymenobacter armeniacus]
MTVWALKNPTAQEHVAFVAASLKQGLSRFGWSYIHRCDLWQLDELPWSELDEDQTDCYKKAHFLLAVKPGDWVVHINVPSYGLCTAAQVIGGYAFDSAPNEVDDFRHTLKIELSTLLEFDRNDANVLPSISNRLRLQGRFWRIGQVAEFEQSIANLTHRAVVLPPNQRAETYHLRNDFGPLLTDLTGKIQKNNPRGKLEEFMAEVLRQVPGVDDVEEHGKHKGWGTDNGADLIVHYQTGLPLPGLRKAAKLVVQVKSYTETHWDMEAIHQIKTAIDHFGADAGLIVTTAQPSKEFKQAFELASTELAEKGKLIGLIGGDDVARFVLKFGGEIIL